MVSCNDNCLEDLEQACSNDNGSSIDDNFVGGITSEAGWL